jgi:hypothetical protein
LTTPFALFARSGDRKREVSDMNSLGDIDVEEGEQICF